MEKETLCGQVQSQKSFRAVELRLQIIVVCKNNDYDLYADLDLLTLKVNEHFKTDYTKDEVSYEIGKLFEINSNYQQQT